MSFHPIHTALTALTAHIVARELSPGVPLFAADAVKPYDRKDLVAALRDLLVFDDRACFLVVAGVRQTDKLEGAVQIVSRELEVALFVTDRNYGGDSTALVGESGENPGVLRIAEQLANSLTADSLGLPGVIVKVEGLDPIELSDKDASETSRSAYAVGIVIPLGELRINLGRRATR